MYVWLAKENNGWSTSCHIEQINEMTDTYSNKPQNIRGCWLTRHLATSVAFVCTRRNTCWRALEWCTIDGLATSNCDHAITVHFHVWNESCTLCPFAPCLGTHWYYRPTMPNTTIHPPLRWNIIPSSSLGHMAPTVPPGCTSARCPTAVVPPAGSPSLVHLCGHIYHGYYSSSSRQLMSSLLH